MLLFSFNLIETNDGSYTNYSTINASVACTIPDMNSMDATSHSVVHAVGVSVGIIVLIVVITMIIIVVIAYKRREKM